MGLLSYLFVHFLGMLIYSSIEGLPSISTEDLRSKLSIEEISAIRQWSKTENGKSELVIVKKLPFGLFLAVGTILFIAEGIITK